MLSPLDRLTGCLIAGQIVPTRVRIYSANTQQMSDQDTLLYMQCLWASKGFVMS
jgi:hypothetical protein